MGRRLSRVAVARKAREGDALIEALRHEIDEGARARPALLSLLSHDLRNPLSVILVSLRMLVRAMAEDHASRRHVDAIARAADEMNGILQDMSDAARLEEGRLTLTLSREDSSAMTLEAVEAARRAAGAKGVSLDVQLASDPGAVMCDRARVQRLLATLVASAVRITPRGGKVEVRSREHEDGVCISISDGGQGLLNDVGDRAFDLPTSSGSNGVHGIARVPITGLALYAARGVLEAHGGEIRIEPAPNGGSMFVLTLPSNHALG